MSKGLSDEDIALATAAAERVVETHKRLVEFVKAGQTLGEIDRFVAKTLDDLNCKSCFLGYRSGDLPPFPSFACLSVNECIVHGTASYLERPIEAGDVVKIDIGVNFRGWIGDAAHTYCIEHMSEDTERVVRAGRESLRRGVQTLRVGAPYMDWAKAVQGCVEDEMGVYLVRGLGGHGYGRKLHVPPFISNTVPENRFFNEWPEGRKKIEPGLLLAVEPMVALTTGRTKQAQRQWPIFTADGSVSVHYEHDVLTTEEGPRVLTAGLEELPNIVG